MRILSLDVGEKRIGTAKADTTTRIAIPIGYVEVDGAEFDQIASLIRLNNIDMCVLGLPRSNQGNETAQSLYVRNFAKNLTERIPNIKIRFQDESLTSVEAEARLKKRKKTYQKGDIDAEAASIILQDFLESFKTTTPPQSSIHEPKTPQIINKPTEIVKKNAQKVMLNSKKVTTKSKNFIRAVIIPPLVLIFCLAIIIGGFFWYKNSLKPVDEICEIKLGRCPTISFVVTEGETVDQIGTNLKQSNLIHNSLSFKLYLKLQKSNTSLKAGKYQLHQGLSTQEIIDLLIAGTKDSDVFSFTIVPGENIFSVKKKLQKIGYSDIEIETAFAKQYDFDVLKNRPAGASLEGYLFGETYEFYSHATVETILETFLRKMDDTAKKLNLEAAFAKQGLTLFEGITLASIVQKEAHLTDQPTVAQVFLLRLKKTIRLDSDVTASYSADIIDPERKIYTSNSSIIKIDECHNTRKNFGIPCGPISSPSTSALLAVANPSNTSYLYFLTGDDGKMYYSYTESEHIKNRNDHCKVLCNTSL